MDSRPTIEIVADIPNWGAVVWYCECGESGVSTNRNYARADMKRHRKVHHSKGGTS